MDLTKEIEDLAVSFEACHKTLSAMGDETRQHIILEMMRMDYRGSRVPDITERTNLSRPAVSHHLQILKAAGIVKMRKEGTMTYQGTTLMNDHMNGEFPVLKPGANAISWTGTVTKVVVRPNWRYL